MDHKKRVILICAILAVVFSLLFIVIRPVTVLFLVSYFFALVGLAGFCYTSCYVIDHKDSYPWLLALPKTALTYLIIELIISAVVVLLEQLAKWNANAVGLMELIGKLNLASGWYVLIHAALLLIFVIRIIALRGGQEHIEARGEQVRKKILSLKLLQADVELLASEASDEGLKKDLSALAEAIRFSDPMSADALTPLEGAIEAKVAKLKLAISDNILKNADVIIKEVNLLIEERNKKCKLLK